MAEHARKRSKLRISVGSHRARPTRGNHAAPPQSRSLKERLTLEGGVEELVATAHRLLRFASSSLICTALDQLIAGVLFVALVQPMHGEDLLRIVVATVIARCFSQMLGFALNHRLVFKPGAGSNDHRPPSRRESLPRFLAVAVGILTLSILGIFALHELFGIQESIAKLIVDLSLFFLNYQLQQRWVFRSEPTIRPRHSRHS